MQRLTRMFPALMPAGVVAGEGGRLTAEAVLAAEDARYAAQMHNDFAAMDRLFGDDLVYFHSGTNVDDKRSFIESMRSGAVRYRRMSPVERQVRVYGEVGVITGRTVFDITVQGQDLTFELLHHSLWVWRPAGLQFVSWQATRLPSQP